MFVPKKPVATPETLPDGEYTAEISRLRMTKDNESVMFICRVTTPGYESENLEVVGYARSNWNKPTGRTTANLYQWVKNLGGNLVDGQEDLFDLETLKGTPCRIIVQSYIGKADGMPRIKVSNILPLNRKPIPNPMAANAGLHVGAQQAVPQAAPQVAPQATAPVQTPLQQMQQYATGAQPVQQVAPAPAPAPAPTTTGSEDPNKLW